MFITNKPIFPIYACIQFLFKCYLTKWKMKYIIELNIKIHDTNTCKGDKRGVTCQKRDSRKCHRVKENTFEKGGGLIGEVFCLQQWIYEIYDKLCGGVWEYIIPKAYVS